MKSVPPIAGLEIAETSRTSSRRITRQHIIIGSFIFLGLLSLSLLIAVIVEAQHNHKNVSGSGSTATGTTTTGTTTTTTPEIINYETCLTQGCISGAAYQLRSMDTTASISLCEDFYAYACGDWQRSHPIQSFDAERTIIGDIINRRNIEIEHLLDAPISRLTPTSWEYKIKTYYSECRDDYARQPNSAQFMLGMMKDPDTIDGWFLLDNIPGTSQDTLLKEQSVYQQMSHIHGDLGVLAIFGLRTRFDENDPSIKRLEFYPAGLSMEVNDYLNNDTVSESRRVAYQLYIAEVLGLLAREAGVNDPNLSDRAFLIASDVYTIEKFLAESLKRSPTDNKPRTMTLIDMSSEFSFNFTELIPHELGDSSVISVLTPVYVTNSMYFTDAFELLGKNNDPLFARMIHNYLRWRLMWTYIEDLSYNYVHAHRIFLDAYYGYALHTSNEAYCTREVIHRFPLAVQRLYTMNSVDNANIVLTVLAIFNSLKDGFKQYMNDHATWMVDDATKNIAKEKIDGLKAAIGYAQVASNDALLDDYYEKFEVTDESHLRNAYYYHNFRRWSLSTSLANPTILDHWDLFETRTSRLFDYIALFNQLFVIASGMHEPLVNSQWPWPMNMGSIGVLLAQKLFASIDGPEGRTHLPNGTRYDWWASPTITAYNNSRNCITDYYVNELQTLTYYINNIPIQIRLAGEPFSPTTLRHIGALRIAYNALMKDNPMKTFKMPGTSLTSQQTFFLAYAQTQCFQRESLAQILQTQLGVYDEKIALNAALIHMPEFTQAFQCTPRPNKCFD